MKKYQYEINRILEKNEDDKNISTDVTFNINFMHKIKTCNLNIAIKSP